MKQHPLVSVRAKFDRARETTAALENEIHQFLTDTEPTISIKDDPATGEKLIGVDGRIVPPPRFAVLAGEIVHHLRSALDHVAYQLVVINGGDPSTSTKIEFPIFLKREDYEAGHERRVRGMSDQAKALIRSLQPFQQSLVGRSGPNHPLWLIHDSDVTDKHRLLVVMARRTAFEHIDYTSTGAAGASRYGGVTITGVSPDASTKANTVVGRYMADPNVEVTPHVDCEVVFERLGEYEHRQVVPTLRDLAWHVAETVEPFVRFFP